MFMPHLDFVGSGHFKFTENAFNVSPFSKGSVGFQSAQCTVSLTSLGAVCSLDRESVAAALKAVFVKFIEAGRSGKFCKLDMRVGYIVAYPNGQLSFENYPDSSQQQEDPDFRGDSRFVRRDGMGNSKTIMMERGTSEMKSNRMRRSQVTAEGGGNKRAQSLYSSVHVSKGGFTKMSQTTSIMTPFTNIGGEVSRYGGKNRLLRHWYEGKVFNPNSKHTGYALNKRDLNVNTNEIYSQFSVTNPDDTFESGQGRSSMNTSQVEQEVINALKNNEFLPEVTFETFLKRKMNRGKRTLFLNKAPNENAREYMKEYMQQA